jgi:hypothetical protein
MSDKPNTLACPKCNSADKVTVRGIGIYKDLLWECATCRNTFSTKRPKL